MSSSEPLRLLKLLRMDLIPFQLKILHRILNEGRNFDSGGELCESTREKLLFIWIKFFSYVPMS